MVKCRMSFLPIVSDSYTSASTRLVRKLATAVLDFTSFILKMFSITCSSVEVVSKPQKAAQSLATRPAEITSLPRFTVPAASGTYT